MSTTFTPDTDELRKIAELPTEAALRRAAAFLASLVKNPHFVQSQILPALDEVRDIADCYLARRHDAKNGSYSLKIFVWPPGMGTKIHDTPSGWPISALGAPCSRSATSASTTAPEQATPA